MPTDEDDKGGLFLFNHPEREVYFPSERERLLRQ